MKTTIMMKSVFLAMGAAAMLVSCAQDQDAPVPVRGGEGSISIDCHAATELELGVVTRASGDQTKLEDMGYPTDYTPTIQRVLVTSLTEGIEYNEPFASPTSFNNPDYNPTLEAGDYMVTIGSSNPLCAWKTPAGDDVSAKEAPTYAQRETLIPQCEEGESKAYFLGTTNVTVEKGVHDKRVDVTMKVINSAVCIDFTEAFKNYFPDAEITLTTKAGAEFTVSYDAENPAPLKYFWIRPQEFTIKGTAKRQAPGTDLPASEVTIKEFKQSSVEPCRLYTVRLDIEEVGGRGLSILINDDIVETITDRVELNPNAPSNLKK